MGIGFGRACASCDSGAVVCWGQGALGDGSNDGGGPDGTIVPVTARVTDVAQLAMAGPSTIVRRRDGTVWSWGDGYNGELGRDGAELATPAAIPGIAEVVNIDAGVFDLCALTSLGQVWCWGVPYYNFDGHEPRLRHAFERVVQHDGAAFGCVRYVDGAVGCWRATRADRMPTASMVPDLRGVRQVSVGVEHACAVLEDHRVACWGANSDGQLGDGTTAPAERPAIVPALLAAEVVAGTRHTCARGLDRRLYCWGDNERGQLGDGTIDDRHQPTPVRPMP